MRKLLPLLLLWPSLLAAQATYTASSCSESAVATAVASEQAAKHDGDIIAIPSGSCSWSSALTQTFTNSVTIEGAGAISATSGGSSTTGTDLTSITDDVGGDVILTTTAGKSLRITGIAFVGSSLASNGMIDILGASSAVRFDHNHVTVTGTSSVGLRYDGSVTGVSDHNYFSSPSNVLTNDIAFHNGVGWNGSSESGNPIGDHSWADTDHFGTSEFMYAEDNQFDNGDVGDAHDGARYVLRYNTILQTVVGNGQMYNHGLTDARGRATRAAEVYMNVFTQPGTTGAGNPAYSINSGALLFWGNTITQYLGVVQIDYTRKNSATYTYEATPNGWGYCGTALGPSNWDENNNSAGYACLDQPGRGKGDLLANDFPSTVDTVTSTITWPNQALDPIYIWDNTYTPSGGYSGSCSGAGCLVLNNDTALLTNNVDFYQQFGTYANSGSFNGTAGVGQGLYSAIPSTCTVGVGYWATDTTTLYVCTATNTWTSYYTPYTYPNPLTQTNAPAPATFFSGGTTVLKGGTVVIN